MCILYNGDMTEGFLRRRCTNSLSEKFLLRRWYELILEANSLVLSWVVLYMQDK